jgi:hypothetical protein
MLKNGVRCSHMSKVEIPINELETGIVGQTDYRFDLKFYSPSLKENYRAFLGGKYPPKFVKDVADVVETGVQIDEANDDDEVQRNEDRIDVKYYRYSRKHPYQHLPLEAIDNLGRFRTDEIDMKDNPDDEFIQVTASRYKGIIYRDRKLGSEIKTRKQTPIETGDIVISRIDLYNGCLGQVPEELNGAIVTRDFMVFVPFKDKIKPLYLEEVLKDDYMADYFYAFAAGCTGRKRITLDTFRQLKIPLLDKETEQKLIVAKINEKENLIHGLTMKGREIYQSAETQFLQSLGIKTE